MAFTYDLDTSRGQVRLLISDTAVSDPTLQLFTDAEIDVFLALHANVKRAAALALDTIAANLAMVMRVMKSGQDSTDGKATAEALRAQAKALRAQADEDDDAAADDGGFSVINFNPNSGWQTTTPSYWSG